MQKITPCLWFDGNAEEAMHFYISVFKDARAGEILRYGKADAEVSGQPEGSALTCMLELHGQEFLLLNGGPLFKFTEAISFSIDCKTQAEVDDLWQKLSAGGEESQCGWLKDKFGLSWQVVPTGLPEMLADPDPAKAQSVMRAMLEMSKLDIKTLKYAYEHP